MKSEKTRKIKRDEKRFYQIENTLVILDAKIKSLKKIQKALRLEQNDLTEK